MCAVELRRGGLRLSGTALWLDATQKSELSFVSHAHSDHIARHERVIATSATLRLMSHRLGEIPAGLPVPYNRPFALGALQIELLPAGHMLGSAQIRVTRDDGRRIAYTGDLNLAPSFTAEAAQVVECDTLILEATFGHPRYRFPPKEQVLSQLESWLREKLDRGHTPVLLGYALGKSQEVIAFLERRGFEVAAHPSICELANIYSEFGVALSPLRRFNGTVRSGEVLVFPPHLSRSASIGRIWPRSVAVLSGWATDAAAIRWYRSDAAFPLSDHADFDSLVDYARRTGAKEVITHGGFAEQLASSLRERGSVARAVGRPLQLRLF
jgi:putative mRNA 3-end processing factor